MGTLLLRAADPEWLWLVVLGGELIRYGSLVAIVFVFGGRWILGALVDMGLPIWSPNLVVRGVIVASLCAALAGAWLVASPDPSEGDDADARPFLQRRSVQRSALVGVVFLLAARLGLDPVLPPVVGAVMSATILAIGLSALRGIGGIVRRLVTRCSDAATVDARNAGAGGAWIFWFIVGIVVLSALPAIFGRAAGWGTIVAAAARLERLILTLGAIAVVLCLYSIAKPMKAIRSEYQAIGRSRG